jgi:hypothetical protein
MVNQDGDPDILILKQAKAEYAKLPLIHNQEFCECVPTG